MLLRKTLIILFLISNLNSYTQTTIDSLMLVLRDVQEQIKELSKYESKLRNEISLLEQKQNSIHHEDTLGVKALVSYLGAKVKTNPEFNSKTIINVKFNDSVYVLERYEKSNWLLIRYKNVTGYLPYKSLKENNELLKLFDSKTAERFINLKKRFGEVNAKRIMNKTYWIGMTADMAIESIGKPNEINRSTGSWGVHEQWVYPKQNYKNLYLYFENGKLSSFQN